jgi:hypothetical protein
MKKLILDYSKWRCGGDGNSENKLGTGFTGLCNRSGFLCCLGQFSLQLNTDITEFDLIGQSEPQDLNVPIELLTTGGEYSFITISDLSGKAIKINDNMDTTPETKIELLKELFSPEGYEIEVINQPKPISHELIR